MSNVDTNDLENYWSDYRIYMTQERIKEKYTDRIPVIVEKKNVSDGLPDIDKKKFLVPQDITVGQMAYVIRKRIKLQPEQALFIVCNGKMPPTSELLSGLYEREADSDFFLYLSYVGEVAYGLSG